MFQHSRCLLKSISDLKQLAHLANTPTDFETFWLNIVNLVF